MLDKRVGFGFFETYDIPLVAGRYFREDISTDVFTPPPNVPEGGQRGASYILSEGAVRALGLAPEEAIGRILEMDFSADFSFTVPGPIIGVVKDVHVQSLRNPIQPLVYSVPGPLWGEERARPVLPRPREPTVWSRSSGFLLFGDHQAHVDVAATPAAH